MSSLVQGKITFAHVNKNFSFTAPQAPMVVDPVESGPEYGGVVNAVDIDWNKGTITDTKKTTVINTSGDLIYLLQEMSKRLTALESVKVPASFTVTPTEITLYTNGVNSKQIVTNITYK